ncbi:hypothetical protein, partial [Faecalibacterium sp. An58]|uniref:hypothetical protein n=1 Tax=Faecalibacterium sp. An58 TaxID=1965648 RepID=UPI0019524107
QSLASCELLFGILSVSNTLKVPLQVFDIVQFSRSCAALSFDRRPVYFTTSAFACQALFLKLFASSFAFCGRPVERSNIILHPGTFVNPFLQVFAASFSLALLPGASYNKNDRSFSI